MAGPLNFDFEKLAHPSLTDIKKLLYEEIARFNAKQAEGEQPPTLEEPQEAPLGSPPKKRRTEGAAAVERPAGHTNSKGTVE